MSCDGCRSHADGSTSSCCSNAAICARDSSTPGHVSATSAPPLTPDSADRQRDRRTRLPPPTSLGLSVWLATDAGGSAGGGVVHMPSSSPPWSPLSPQPPASSPLPGLWKRCAAVSSLSSSFAPKPWPNAAATACCCCDHDSACANAALRLFKAVCLNSIARGWFTERPGWLACSAARCSCVSRCCWRFTTTNFTPRYLHPRTYACGQATATQ